jgi:hypothetical protein
VESALGGPRPADLGHSDLGRTGFH